MVRDSKWWWVLMIGSVITAIANNLNAIDPLLPPDSVTTVHAWINVLSILIAAISGKLMNSPLPHSDDANVVNR